MRLPVSQRLRVLGSVMALCADRGPLHVAELAAEIGVPAESVRQSLAPLADLELVEDGFPLLDITHDVSISDDVVEVHFNWLRDLASLRPGDAARLYVQIAAARELSPEATRDLGSLRRRLAALAGTISFRDDMPALAVELLRHAEARRVVEVRVRAQSTMPIGPYRGEVHRVSRTGDRWSALIRFLDHVPGLVDAGELRSIDLHRITEVEGTAERFVPMDLGPSHLPFSTPVRVTIRHTTSTSWLLDRHDVHSQTTTEEGDCLTDATVGGVGELAVLMARLGGDGRITEPDDLTGLQSDLARRMLAVYDEG